MTDTTVSSHVSEEEMSTIQGLFARAANAIVDVSRLSTQVKDLEARVGDLSNQVNSYRSQIAWQDDMIGRMRNERDQAKDAAAQALRDKDAATQELNRVSNEIESLARRLAIADETMRDTVKERDDAQFKALELEDRATKAEAGLAKIQSTLGELLPKPITPVQPQTEPVIDAGHTHFLGPQTAGPEGETEEERQRRVGIDQPRAPGGQYRPWEEPIQKEEPVTEMPHEFKSW